MSQLSDDHSVRPESHSFGFVPFVEITLVFTQPYTALYSIELRAYAASISRKIPLHMSTRGT